MSDQPHFHIADDVLAEFNALPVLPDMQRAWLASKGIEADDRVMRFSRVTFSEGYFDLVDEGGNALILMASDAFGRPSDLFAIAPRTGETGLWLRREYALGLPIRRGFSGAPVLVFGDALEWLTAGREGICIVNWSRLPFCLIGVEPLAVTSQETGRRIRDAFQLTPPAMLLAESRGIAA